MIRMLDLVENADDCKKQLKKQLSCEERILKLAELCRKYETEREKVLPFYSNADVDLDELNFEVRVETCLAFGNGCGIQDEEHREEIRDVLKQQQSSSAAGCDESTYLDTFFKKVVMSSLMRANVLFQMTV